MKAYYFDNIKTGGACKVVAPSLDFAWIVIRTGSDADEWTFREARDYWI